jgi:hypothetical protein
MMDHSVMRLLFVKGAGAHRRNADEIALVAHRCVLANAERQ